MLVVGIVFFFQAEDGIRDLVRSRGLGDVYKRQLLVCHGEGAFENIALDAVFPVLHGTCGEDGTIQGLSLIHI